MSTYAIHSKTRPGQSDVATARTGCGCKEPEPPPCECALCCFERPQYFCGHLLSSEDLSLQLRYDIEKNKLRNRTLHGHGVVCGLKLACDPDCEGAILVSTGYGIDDCGNDLVVCESTRFHVIKRLREKQLIEGPPRPPEDCGKVEGSEDDECPELRCFYVVACYTEEPYAYETPFQAGCGSGPAACQPTRIRERVSFDVLASLPKGPVDDEAACLKALEESELIKELRANVQPILAILDKGSEGQREFEYCDLLCRLKKLFRRLVKAYPPAYTCDLVAQIDAVTCPAANDAEVQGNTMYDAYCELLNLIFTFAVECVLDALAVSCADPCERGCVLLGAVYVENGVLKRVCNTPRQYVWSFANLWNIVQLELVMSALRDATRRSTLEERNPEMRVRCCPDYELDCGEFVKALALSERSFSRSVNAFPTAVSAFIRSTAAAFDFTKAGNIAPDLYVTSAASIDNLKFKMSGSATVENPATVAPAGDMFSEFMSHALIQRGAPVFAINSPKGDQVRLVRDPAFGLAVPGAPPPDADRVTTLEQQATASRETIARLQEALKSSQDSVATLNKSLVDLTGRVDTLSKTRLGKTAPPKGDEQ